MSQRVFESLKKKFPSVSFCNITPPVENVIGKTETTAEIMVLEPAPEKLKSLGTFDSNFGTSHFVFNKTNVILYFVPSFTGPRLKIYNTMVNVQRFPKVLTLLIFFRQKGLTTPNALETIFECPISEITEKKYEKLENHLSQIQVSVVESASTVSALVPKTA